MTTSDYGLAAQLRDTIVRIVDQRLEQWAAKYGRGNGVTVESDTYTPTLGAMAIGTGGSAANIANYTFIGNSVEGVLTVEGQVIFGTSAQSFPSGTVTVALPVGFRLASLDTAARRPVGLVDILGVGAVNGFCWHQTASTIRFVTELSNSTHGSTDGISTTNPWTWVAGDAIKYQYHVRVVRV